MQFIVLYMVLLGEVVVGFIARIVYVVMGYKLGLGLVAFGTACTFDFGMRTLFMLRCINKHENGMSLNKN